MRRRGPYSLLLKTLHPGLGWAPTPLGFGSVGERLTGHEHYDFLMSKRGIPGRAILTKLQINYNQRTSGNSVATCMQGIHNNGRIESAEVSQQRNPEHRGR